MKHTNVKKDSKSIPISPPLEGSGEANPSERLIPGDRYIARWHFNYDQCDILTGEIEIIVVYPDQSYLFSHTNKWGTTTWNSSRCRHLELIRKIEGEE
jgi:hypothetical protein